jgi:hypothetical protein
MRTSPLAEDTLRVTSDESHAPFIKDVVVIAEVVPVEPRRHPRTRTNTGFTFVITQRCVKGVSKKVCQLL